MKVIGWTEWLYYYNWECTTEEFEEAWDATVKELKEKGYHFDGSYHQNGDFGVPVLDNGERFQVSMRRWGCIMADALPEEFEDLNNSYNYVRWYLGAEEICKKTVLHPDGSKEYYFEESDI